ncbi:hypothetical protein [Nitrosomonas sp. Nm34]|uniref:hypothetical protein n=1 Tax=Nitrosomonas sp. Nm34 TaxID=1881055 RepID=UPI0008DF6317|nr:hypothetical protein [Nitrosomonas sp. Nm34]SFI76273.1 hypothetical protein SAMN05428978_103322 [Nitrosomonas sp. Nm34]
MENHEHSKIIDKLGGTSATAKLLKISSQAVSKFRKTGIPEARLMYLQAIRPDLFGIERRVSQRRKLERRNEYRRKAYRRTGEDRRKAQHDYSK